METDRLEKITELLKYSIVSIFIASSSIIITDLFREREQEIKELEYFDKYINEITKVDNINYRLSLSKYLSIVAPVGNLKESWKIYYDSVQVEYKNFKTSTVFVEDVKRDPSLIKTNEDKAKYNEAIDNIEKGNSPLISKKNSIGTIYFQITKPELKEFSNVIIAKLQQINYKAIGTEYVKVNLKTNEIRYFNDVDFINANQLQEDLKKYGLETSVKRTMVNSIVPIGQLEVWIVNNK